MHRLAILSAVINLAACQVATFYDRAVALARSLVDFVLNAMPTPQLAGNGGFTGLLIGGHAPSYDVPPAHSLRHEAGVKRRDAARNC